MDDLEYVRSGLAARTWLDFKRIETETGVKRWTQWRIATGRTLNPGVNTVRAVRDWLKANP